MPSWRELKRYCESDGWELYKSTDHDYYRKIETDGTVRRTKVSRGSGEIPAQLWKRILSQQLGTTQEKFNQKI